MKLPVLWTIVAVAVFLLPAAGCGPTAQAGRPHLKEEVVDLSRFEYSKIYMGVRTRLVVYASDETAAVNACRAAFDRVGQVEQAASDYLKDSELNHLCATATTRPVKLSDDLYTLLSESQRIAALSDGAFDVTVGPYVQLWRKARKDKQLPTPQEIAQASQKVGWRKLTLEDASHAARLAVSGMKLDLGGIAKGYAGDCAIQTLRDHGIRSALFEAGGDIVISDPPPGKEGWEIELVDAGPDMPRSLTLHNGAISTSGDTEQFVEIGGKRYSHVVDPHTGIGLTTRAMSTVVAPKGIWSDGLSKPAEMLPKAKLDEFL
ncbi:MAG TPA: FAD:protein FMN transferase, partial [Tepidisphaeraceae bacterium]